MAGKKKISELPAAAAIVGTELIEVVQSAVSKQSTVSDIAGSLVKDEAFGATWDADSVNAASRGTLKTKIDTMDTDRGLKLVKTANLSDLADAVTATQNLGVEIGVDVQEFGAILDDFNTLGAATIDGQFVVATGAGAFAYESGATARTSMDVAQKVASSTDNAIVRFNGTTGEQQNSGVTIDASDNLVIPGNLTVSGTTTTVNSTTIEVADSLFKYAKDNDATDVLDIGWYGLYDTSGSLDLFAGMFRDASDNKFHMFVDLQVEPTTTVNKAGAGYTVATLVANLDGTINTATQNSVTTMTALATVGTVMTAGKTEIGDWPNTANNAYLGHSDLNHSSAGAYAIRQNSVGKTFVNSAGGQTLDFQISGATQFRVGVGSFDLLSGSYLINSAAVLSTATLASSVINSSLTSVGILTGLSVGASTADELTHFAKAVDGISVGLLIENSEANAGGSTNETAEIRFGFGGNNDVARIIAGKEEDYTVGANEDSFLAFYTDLDGTATEQMRLSSTGQLGIANGAGNLPQYRLDVGNLSYFAINGNFAHIIQHNNAASTFWSIAPRNNGDFDIAVTTTDPRPSSGTIGTSDNAISIKSDKTVDFISSVTATNLKTHALIEDRSPTASTTSTSFVTLESSASTTFSGRPVLCFVSVTMFPSTTNIGAELAIQIDSGSDAVVAKLLHNESEHNTIQGAVIVTPSAGSHTLRIRWRLFFGGGGGNNLTLDANDQILLHAVEL